MIDKINKNNLPKHLAIIMDGNGRWANKKGMDRIMGHKKGIQVALDIANACNDIGIKYLTLFAFSDENWNRPKNEVSGLFGLMNTFINKQIKVVKKTNIKIITMGTLNRLPASLKTKIDKIVEETKSNKSMKLVLAIGYSSKNEITYAVKKIASKVKKGDMQVEDINKNTIRNNMYYKSIPDVDFLIRTSGEKRLSNFMLWQLAYSELYFIDKLWPEFDKKDLYEAIIDYQKRERRFGNIF